MIKDFINYVRIQLKADYSPNKVKIKNVYTFIGDGKGKDEKICNEATLTCMLDYKVHLENQLMNINLAIEEYIKDDTDAITCEKIGCPYLKFRSIGDKFERLEEVICRKGRFIIEEKCENGKFKKPIPENCPRGLEY